MFCVFLQDTPSKDDLLVKFIHNDDEYELSRNLSLNHSNKLADLIMSNDNNAINLEYYHELDDFQLICDLFNYKRIFITKSNIDFLQFAANFFEIPILIKKTAKFQSQYTNFISNPVFKKIKTLRKQVFSIFNPSNDFSEENESDDDLKNDEIDNIQEEQETKQEEQETKQEEQETKQEEHDENSTKLDDSNKEETNKNEEKTEKKEESEKNEKINNIPTIQYEPEYSSTVSHLLFAAILFDPLNIDKYLQIVVNDKILLIDFIKTIHCNKLGRSITDFLEDILSKHLQGTEKSILFDETENTSYKYDTQLTEYLANINNFLTTNYPIWHQYEGLTELIKNDDIDEFQIQFTSNPKLMNDIKIYSCFFKLSMISSSINCFKYFLVNWSTIFGNLIVDKQIVQPAIIGGNIEIFRLILEKYDGNPADFIKDSILFHKKDIFDWIVENYCQFLSLYNSCCSTVIYGRKYVTQKWYNCDICYTRRGNGCCKFCAKHCHLNNDDNEKLHDVKYSYISRSCFCDDDCELSKNIEPIGNKKFVEIDDLILLSIFCLNTDALKALIDEGGYIVRCRDRATKNAYVLNDQKLIELIKNLDGYKEKFIDELNESKNENDHVRDIEELRNLIRMLVQNNDNENNELQRDENNNDDDNDNNDCNIC